MLVRVHSTFSEPHNPSVCLTSFQMPQISVQSKYGHQIIDSQAKNKIGLEMIQKSMLHFTLDLELLVLHRGFNSRSDLDSMTPRGKFFKLLVTTPMSYIKVLTPPQMGALAKNDRIIYVDNHL